MHTPDDWRAYAHRKPSAIAYGGVEILGAGPHDVLAAATAWVQFVGTLRVGTEAVNHSVASSCTVILPPDAPPFHTDALVRALVAELPGEDPDEVQLRHERIRDRVHVLRLVSLDGQAVVERIAALDDPHPFVLVAQSDRYETGPADRIPAHVDVNAWLWADRLARLAEACAEVVSQTEGAVFLLSERDAPHDESVRRRLMEAHQAVGVTLIGPLYGPDDLPARLPHLLRGAREGRLPEVLRTIEGLGLDPVETASIRAQAFQMAGQPADAFEQIEPHLAALSDAETPLLVAKYARICHLDARPGPARQFLARLLELQPADEMSLGVGAETADGVGDDDAADWLYERLGQLFPHADSSLRRSFFAAETPEDFAALAGRIEARVAAGAASPEAQFIALVARTLGTPGSLETAADLAALFEAVRQLDPDRVASAAMPIAMRLVAWGRPLLGARAALAWTDVPFGPPERGQLRVLLRALEGFFAGVGATDVPTDALTDESVGVVEASLRTAADVLRRHPESRLRLELAALMDPLAGGAYALAFVSETLETAPVIVAGTWELPPPAPRSEGIGDQVLDLVVRVSEDAARMGAFMVGHGDLPPLGSLDAREAINHIRRLLGSFSAHDADEGQRRMALALLHVALRLVRDVGVPGEAYELVTLAGGVLATLGHPQTVRDLAEQVFSLRAESADDHVDAWLAHADLYLQVRRPTEALAALMIASTDAARAWRPSTAYHACLLRARAYRDLGFLDHGLRAVQYAREIAAAAGLSERVEERLDSVADGIRLAQTLGNLDALAPDAARTNLSETAAYLVGRLRTVADSGESPLPAASLVASLVPYMERHGADAEPARDALRDVEQGLTGQAARILRDLVEGAEGVPYMAAGVGDTRQAEDAATDIVVVGRSARRALARGGQTATATATLVEWLADRSVKPVAPAPTHSGAHREDLQRRLVRATMDGTDRPRDREALRQEVAAHPPEGGRLAPADGTALADLADALARRGASALAFATSADGHLVVVAYGQDGLVAHHVNAFSSDAFAAWRRTYPAGYQGSEAGQDLGAFERSLAALALPVDLDGGPLVLAPEASLQSLPPNLITSDRTPPGESPLVALRRPTATVPSLTWLRSSLAVSPVVAGARVAWIPTPLVPSPNRLFSELQILQESLAPTLSNSGFVSHASTAVPPLHYAGIAVVGAHGGVHTHGGSFRAVTDDDGLVLSPHRVADAVGGAAVVILFVCHGGRADGHPRAVATVGLATRLLGEGTRAVVACPWPLDLSVPQYWLPAFLEAWTGPVEIARAVFEANRAVAARYSQQPSAHLAMNLTGDPFLVLGETGDDP